MPRLRNKLTGAVMTVPEAAVARLGSEWVDAAASDAKSEDKPPARARKTASDN